MQKKLHDNILRNSQDRGEGKYLNYFNLNTASMLQLCCNYAANMLQKIFFYPSTSFHHFCGTNLPLFTNLCDFLSICRLQAQTTSTKLKSGRNDHVDICTWHPSRARKFSHKLVMWGIKWIPMVYWVEWCKKKSYSPIIWRIVLLPYYKLKYLTSMESFPDANRRDLVFLTSLRQLHSTSRSPKRARASIFFR